jgi:hypothetical protein
LHVHAVAAVFWHHFSAVTCEAPLDQKAELLMMSERVHLPTAWLADACSVEGSCVTPHWLSIRGWVMEEIPLATTRE